MASTKMKYLLFSLPVLACSGLRTQAQELKAPKTHDGNYLYYNPAYAGSQDKRDLSISVQPQNNTITSGRFLYSTSINEGSSGAGTIINYQRGGAYQRRQASFPMSKVIKMGDKARIVMGISPTAKMVHVDHRIIGDVKPTDAQKYHIEAALKGDVDAGAWLQVNGFFAGGAVQNLIEPKYEFRGPAAFQDKRQLNTMAGYKIQLNENAEITPSVLYTKPLAGSNGNVAADLTGRYRFLVAGATIRSKGQEQAPATLHGGVQLGKKVQFLMTNDIGKGTSPVPQPKNEASVRFQF
jgi:type IX secretion system PorP/SprF family membrane protein